MTIRALIVFFRRCFLALILVIFSATVALNVAKAYGLTSSDFDANDVFLVKVVGTVAAAAVVYSCLLCLFSFDVFREVFVNDRFYLGAGGSVMKPRTFKNWLNEGGDLVYEGEIYYNSILIRPAEPGVKKSTNEEGANFKEARDEDRRPSCYNNRARRKDGLLRGRSLNR